MSVCTVMRHLPQSWSSTITISTTVYDSRSLHLPWKMWLVEGLRFPPWVEAVTGWLTEDGGRTQMQWSRREGGNKQYSWYNSNVQSLITVVCTSIIVYHSFLFFFLFTFLNTSHSLALALYVLLLLCTKKTCIPRFYKSEIGKGSRLALYRTLRAGLRLKYRFEVRFPIGAEYKASFAQAKHPR